jgi:transcriptional regulator with XRE-family HTH domain
MTKIDKLIASNVVKLRKSRGWTQEKLAEEAKMSVTGVQRLEAGERFPRPKSLESLARVFSVQPWELLVDSDIQELAKEPLNTLTFTDAVSLLEAYERAPHDKRSYALFLLTGQLSHLGDLGVEAALEAFSRVK